MNIRLLSAVLVMAVAMAVVGNGLMAQDTPAADPPAAKDITAGLLAGMTPEEIEILITHAIQARLKMERSQVAAEIKRGLLYDDDHIDKALTLLADNPANTQTDNIDRICKAFAIVYLRFDKMSRLRKAGKYARAADAAKAMLKGQESTYLSAAQHFLCADSLIKAGKWKDGVDVYGELLVAMPDRISFAAEAAARSAETYEKNGRFLNAMKMYAFCVRNYGLAMDKARLLDVIAKIDKYGEIYKAPMTAIADLMGTVQRRLESVDSGKVTRAKEDEIIALLDDLIKTAEEQQKQPPPGSKRERDKQSCKKCGGKDKNCSSCSGKGQGKGNGKGNGQNPTSPMQDSSLPPGVVRRPPKDKSAVRPTDETGDWAALPPREKQKIEQIRRKLISERYRSAISDYHTRMAEGKKAGE